MCRITDAPQWMSAPRVVCLGVRLIVEGVLDHGAEGDLASECGVSSRHLRRMFNDHLGITPSRLARASRMRRAARLLVATDLAVADIAHQAGFGSIRQLNRVCRDVLGTSPIELRRREVNQLAATEILDLRIPTSPDFEWTPMLDHLASRAVPHVECVDGSVYRRVVVVDGVPGALEVSVPDGGQLVMRVHLQEWHELLHVVQRALSIVDPEGMARESGDDSPAPERGAESPRSQERVQSLPGVWEPFERSVTAILTAHLPQSDVRTVTSNLVQRLGTPVQTAIHPQLTRSFPSPETLAASNLRNLGLGSSTEDALRRLAIGVTDGTFPLNSTSDIGELEAALASWGMIDEAGADYVATRIGRAGEQPSRHPTSPAGYPTIGKEALEVDGLRRQTKSA